MCSDNIIPRWFVRPALLLLAAFLAGWAGGWTGPKAHAQNIERIAAVVNDDVLSLHDVQDRTRYAIALSNLPDGPELRRRVAGQVLRKLIDEVIQRQEAARVKVSVSEAEIDQAVQGVERRNNMPPGAFAQFLNSKGINPEVGRQQIKADLLWLKLVRQTQQAFIRVSEDEISLEMERLRASRGQPEYLLAEIFLPFDVPAQEAEVKSLAERLIEQMNAGASFPQLAEQFSQSASAAAGGDLGWVSDQQLDPELRPAVLQTQPGTLSPLVRTQGGFYILTVRERRLAPSELPPREEVTRHLEADKMEIMSRRLLRDLRRSAFIDIRL